MKMFVWARVAYASNNYHHEGGILVVADNLSKAREVILKECSEKCGALTEEPNFSLEVLEPASQTIFIFPDAGCC